MDRLYVNVSNILANQSYTTDIGDIRLFLSAAWPRSF